MPITFLNPALLLGALSAAVPLLLHLWRRRRARRVAFSDLRLLEEVQVRQSRSLGLRRTLLLILRMLILILLAAAAARPRLDGVAGGGAAGSMLFVLDGSASMGVQTGEGDRFDAAKKMVAETAAGLDPDTAIQVVLAGDAPRALFSDWIPAGSDLAAVLADIGPDGGSCDLPAALAEAATWIGAARRTPATVTLVSDLQATGIDPEALRAAGEALEAAGAERILVRRAGEPTPNGGVKEIGLPLRALSPGEPMRIDALVAATRPGQPFHLEIDGRRVAEAAATGPRAEPDGEGSDAAESRAETERIAFFLTAPDAGVHRGRVLTDSDRFAADDALPFIFTVREDIPVLLVHEPGGGAAGRGGWRYLKAALDPGAAGGLFDVREVAAAGLQPGDLEDVAVAVFVDPGPFGRRFTDGLLAWLDRGGRAAVLAGDPGRSDHYADVLLPALGLAGEATPRVRSEAGAEGIAARILSHPVLSDLPADALGILGEARWRRYLAVAEPDSLPAALVFDGGDPALVEVPVGEGMCVVLPFHLSPGDTDLALNPMFPPLARRLVAYLAAGGGAVGNGTVGQRPRVRLSPDGNREAFAAAEAVDDRGEVHAAGLEWIRGVPWLTAAPARRSGFFTFVAGGDTLGTAAAATPAAEGESRLLAVAEFSALLEDAGWERPLDLGGIPAEGLAEALAGREIASWFFALAFLLLLAEVKLARGTGKITPPA